MLVEGTWAKLNSSCLRNSYTGHFDFISGQLRDPSLSTVYVFTTHSGTLIRFPPFSCFFTCFPFPLSSLSLLLSASLQPNDGVFSTYLTSSRFPPVLVSSSHGPSTMEPTALLLPSVLSLTRSSLSFLCYSSTFPELIKWRAELQRTVGTYPMTESGGWLSACLIQGALWHLSAPHCCD